MQDGSEVLEQNGLREAEPAMFGLAPAEAAPPLLLAGTDEDENEDGPTIVRSID